MRTLLWGHLHDLKFHQWPKYQNEKIKEEMCNLLKLTFHETGNWFKYQGIHQQSHLPFQWAHPREELHVHLCDGPAMKKMGTCLFPYQVVGLSPLQLLTGHLHYHMHVSHQYVYSTFLTGFPMLTRKQKCNDIDIKRLRAEDIIMFSIML